MRRCAGLRQSIFIVVIALVGARPVRAQRSMATAASPVDAVPATAPAGDVAAAARAFDEGQRAQLRREYEKAAELFELADRMAPSAAALRSAIRNNDAAGSASEAATGAARALARYGDDADTRRFAEAVLARWAPTLGAIDVACAPPCSLVIDGRANAAGMSARERVYVAPGEHAVAAQWNDGRDARRAVAVGAGETKELALAPPVVAQAVPSGEPMTTPAAWVAKSPARRRRLAPYVAVIGAVVTLGLASALVWSGVDTLAARDRYANRPTAAGFHDGIGREERTDGLIAGVAVAGAATVVIATFGTDWKHGFGGHRHSEPRP